MGLSKLANVSPLYILLSCVCAVRAAGTNYLRADGKCYEYSHALKSDNSVCYPDASTWMQVEGAETVRTDSPSKCRNEVVKQCPNKKVFLYRPESNDCICNFFINADDCPATPTAEGTQVYEITKAEVELCPADGDTSTPTPSPLESNLRGGRSPPTLTPTTSPFDSEARVEHGCDGLKRKACRENAQCTMAAGICQEAGPQGGVNNCKGLGPDVCRLADGCATVDGGCQEVGSQEGSNDCKGLSPDLCDLVDGCETVDGGCQEAGSQGGTDDCKGLGPDLCDVVDGCEESNGGCRKANPQGRSDECSRHEKKAPCADATRCTWLGTKKNGLCVHAEDASNIASDIEDAVKDNLEDSTCTGLGEDACANEDRCRWSRRKEVCLEPPAESSMPHGGASDSMSDEVKQKLTDSSCDVLEQIACGDSEGCRWSRRKESCLSVLSEIASGLDGGLPDADEMLGGSDCASLAEDACADKEGCRWSRRKNACLGGNADGMSALEDGLDGGANDLWGTPGAATCVGLLETACVDGCRWSRRKDACLVDPSGAGSHGQNNRGDGDLNEGRGGDGKGDDDKPGAGVNSKGSGGTGKGGDDKPADAGRGGSGNGDGDEPVGAGHNEGRGGSGKGDGDNLSVEGHNEGRGIGQSNSGDESHGEAGKGGDGKPDAGANNEGRGVDDKAADSGDSPCLGVGKGECSSAGDCRWSRRENACVGVGQG